MSKNLIKGKKLFKQQLEDGRNGVNLAHGWFEVYLACFDEGQYSDSFYRYSEDRKEHYEWVITLFTRSLGRHNCG